MFSKRVERGDPSFSYRRKESLSVGDALERLSGELRRLYAKGIVISSNLRVREDGMPYAQQPKQLDDPGVAVYFTLNGKPRTLACDKWSSAADNMAAIAGHISSIRAVDRYGVGTLDQAFAGYAALPPSADDWRSVFNLSQSATLTEMETAFRALAIQHHPDKGGYPAVMAKLNAARDAAKKEMSA